ncbi:MAG: TonB-dependent receptor, partial [Lysobacterales bacterium]
MKSQKMHTCAPIRKLAISLYLFAFFLIPMQDVLAQEDSDEAYSGVLEEVMVTSRRYVESIGDVPVSVNVMTAEDLEAGGLTNVRDIIDFSPGGVTTSFNKMQDEYSLRGVSSQTEGPSGDSSVATVIDSVPITREFMKSQAFFDMESVEILRGPQGTSFGRNASSGLIHFKTARPQSEFGSSFTAEAGSDEQYRVEGYVTGALGENVAGRLAVSYTSLDGFTTDTRSGEGLGGEENFSLRGTLLFNPSDSVEIYLKAQYSKDDDDNPTPRKGKDCTIPYQADFPAPSVVGAPQPGWTQFPNWFDDCDPWKTTISSPTYLGPFFMEREITTLTAIVTLTFGDGLTLTSVTGYVDGNSDYLIDAHGGPNDSMFQNTQNDGSQLSQEFRLDNQGADTKTHWLAGIY